MARLTADTAQTLFALELTCCPSVCKYLTSAAVDVIDQPLTPQTSLSFSTHGQGILSNRLFFCTSEAIRFNGAQPANIGIIR